jgi:hypothetical protein
MKKYFGLTIAIMMFVAVLASAAQAQSKGSPLMHTRIPFAFHVGSRELPAGEYNISVLNPSSDRKVLQIRSADGRVSAMVSTVDLNAKATDKSKVVFHRYGDTCFFAQAQVGGESTTIAALKSSAERNEARMVAKLGRTSSTLTIAAE